MNDVRLVARWDGWCDPCETERPLLLTESGQRGLRAWLHGVGAEDRALVLTCAVCGEWQAIEHDEADLDEPIAYPTSWPAALHRFGVRQIIVSSPAAPAVVYPAALHRFGVRQIIVSSPAAPAVVSPAALHRFGVRQIIVSELSAPVAVSPITLHLLGTRQVVLRLDVPAPRRAATADDETMDLLAEGFDLISLAS